MFVSIFAGIMSLVSSMHRKADYYRYLAEFKSGDDRKAAADESLRAYEVNLFCWLYDSSYYATRN